MSNPGMLLTTLGRNILAKGLLGKEIRFSKVAYGDGEFDYETEKVSELTKLKSWKLDLPLIGAKMTGDGTVEIMARLMNFELEEGFCAKEHGVFAIDPDTNREILYAYRNAGEEYSFIPANTGPVHKNTVMAYRVEIQDAANVTFNIDYSFAYTAEKDFSEHIEAAHPHPNIPNHYKSVSWTENFWATGGDNHLHKISVDNTKKVLLGEFDERISKQNERIKLTEDYISAQKRLGLNANLVIVEDFNPETTTDKTKIKVTSCAKGGDLIGLKENSGVKIGRKYWLTDGINQELVEISSTVYSFSSYHAKVTERLTYDYNVNDAYLITSTMEDKLQSLSDKRFIRWSSSESFGGFQANYERIIFFETNCDNYGAFSIEGDGILTKNGELTLRN